jgi:hypothetical protein
VGVVCVTVVASSHGSPVSVKTAVAVVAFRVSNLDTGSDAPSTTAEELLDAALGAELLRLLLAASPSRRSFLRCGVCPLEVIGAAGAGQTPHLRHPPFFSGTYTSPRAREQSEQLQ